MQQRIVQRFSVVYIATGDKTQVYRSSDEIPVDVRERLGRLARHSQLETRIIANEKGRDLLQSEQWARRVTPPPAGMPKPIRWAAIAILGAGLGLVLTWLQQLR